MVGRDLGDYFPPRNFAPSHQTVLEVAHLSSALFEDVSFTVKRGEVLGFSGLIGAGRTEIMKSIFGVLPYHAGEVKLDGRVLAIRSALEAKRAGLAYVPEDRKREGLVLSLSLANNIVLSSLERISKGGHIQKKTKRELVRKLVNDLQIHPKDPERLALYYSGGNQQKAVIAKWLTTQPRVMILDEPTRGIDIGAKIEIYHLINDLAMNGVAVIVISSELTELIGICDRILVVSNGRMTGEFNRPDFSQDAIMFAATNIKAGLQKQETAS